MCSQLTNLQVTYIKCISCGEDPIDDCYLLIAIVSDIVFNGMTFCYDIGDQLKLYCYHTSVVI